MCKQNNHWFLFSSEHNNPAGNLMMWFLRLTVIHGSHFENQSPKWCIYMFNRKSRFYYCNPILGSLVLCYAIVTNIMDFLLHASDYLLILSNSALLLDSRKRVQGSKDLPWHFSLSTHALQNSQWLLCLKCKAGKDA